MSGYAYLDVILIITGLCVENSIVLKLKVACFLKCKEKGKLINIQTLKSKKELVLLLRCFLFI